MIRTEYDLESWSVTEVVQVPYQSKDDEGLLILVDATEKAPEGFVRISDKQFQEIRSKK